MKFNPSIFNKYRVAWHVLFWLAYLIFFSAQYGYTSSEYIQTFLRQCSYLPILMTATYFYIYYLIPRYLLTKKYKTFFPVFFLSAIVFTIALRFITKYVMAKMFFTPEMQKQLASIDFFHPVYILSHIFAIYSIVFIAAFIKLVKQWYAEQQRNQQLMQDKLEAELKFLKSQIHPHVLFNVLNNIYGLSLAGSKNTPNMILKLSSLLDFMLYECNSERILLDKELNMLNNYIELEKLRYGGRLKLRFETNGNTSGVTIAPLLLFPFVENSFKHGVGKETEESWINITLNVDEEKLELSIENNKSEEDKNGNSGIGLNNVKRQLELLYKDKYSLEIINKQTTFFIKLNLEHNHFADEN